MSTSVSTGEIEPKKFAQNAAVNVLFALSFAHMLNDIVQALLPSIYPMLKETYHLNFTQIGLITLAYQITGSLLQPVVGFYTDRRPKPYSLAVGMGVTATGLILLSQASSFHLLVISAMTVGVGSSIFHPEASRVARMASGGKHGFAQSLFQVGGNFGTSLGPLLAAWIIIPRGQAHILWFTALAFLGMAVLAKVGGWYSRNMERLKPKAAAHGDYVPAKLSRGKVVLALLILVALIFSKYFYLISLTNYYTFYLIDKFQLSVQSAQICLFVFLFAVAAGTIIGGPVGDRIGRKRVIWISILGVAPFSLCCRMGLVGTVVLTLFIGVILASAFSAILVYATELVPGNVGLIAGLFFGLAFGAAGIGSALLGRLADHTSIRAVFDLAAFFPLIGLATAFLPEVETKRRS